MFQNNSEQIPLLGMIWPVCDRLWRHEIYQAPYSSQGNEKDMRIVCLHQHNDSYHLSAWGKVSSDLDETWGNSSHKPRGASYTAPGAYILQGKEKLRERFVLN